MTVDLTTPPEEPSGRYRLVSGTTLDTLSTFVTNAMDAGWICQGSPFFNDRGQVWLQAMVRIVQAPAGEVRLKEPKRNVPPYAAGKPTTRGLG